VPAADRCGPQDPGSPNLRDKSLEANRRESTPADTRHFGFTLIDLIAVVCAVALVTAIAVYGIQQSRIRARSLGCRDNLRQIGVALSQYTDTYRTLPTVTFVGSDYRLTHSPLALLVPLLPQESRASLWSSAGTEASYDSTQPWFRQREGFAAAVVPTFRCPASRHPDPVESIEAERTHSPLGTLLATTDYIVCKGPNDSWCLDGGVSAVPLKDRGAFEIGRPLGFGDIPDGLAQTIVVGEATSGRQWPLALKDRFPLTLIDRQTMRSYPAFNYWGWPLLNTSAEQQRTQVVAASLFGTTAVELNRRPVVETILNTNKLDDCNPRYKNGFHAVSNFRSDHEGGAYFLFADGASHFVSEGIVPEVYRALSSIAGAESVDYIN
jgi:type II secretory pathway pseudopilin PulG